MSQIKSFRDLKVYQKLKGLHLNVSEVSLTFPKFEMYELGSQVRRSSNSAAAILAEGWGSRHTNIYLEAINRSMGEVRESQHHLDVAKDKKYLNENQSSAFDGAYDECGRMLERLYEFLCEWRGSKRQPAMVREELAPYQTGENDDRQTAVEITMRIMNEFQ